MRALVRIQPVVIFSDYQRLIQIVALYRLFSIPCTYHCHYTDSWKYIVARAGLRHEDVGVDRSGGKPWKPAKRILFLCTNITWHSTRAFGQRDDDHFWSALGFTFEFVEGLSRLPGVSALAAWELNSILPFFLVVSVKAQSKTLNQTIVGSCIRWSDSDSKWVWSGSHWHGSWWLRLTADHWSVLCPVRWCLGSRNSKRRWSSSGIILS